MPTFVIFADVRAGSFQNPQELGALWGEVEADIEAVGGTPRESFVVAGEFDLLLTFEVEDVETALRVAIAIQRHGLETRTMPVLPIERLGDLVEDV